MSNRNAVPGFLYHLSILEQSKQDKNSISLQMTSYKNYVRCVFSYNIYTELVLEDIIPDILSNISPDQAIVMSALGILSQATLP